VRHVDACRRPSSSCPKRIVPEVDGQARRAADVADRHQRRHEPTSRSRSGGTVSPDRTAQPGVGGGRASDVERHEASMQRWCRRATDGSGPGPRRTRSQRGSPLGREGPYAAIRHPRGTMAPTSGTPAARWPMGAVRGTSGGSAADEAPAWRIREERCHSAAGVVDASVILRCAVAGPYAAIRHPSTVAATSPTHGRPAPDRQMCAGRSQDG
jgi:hypothetical protein